MLQVALGRLVVEKRDIGKADWLAFAHVPEFYRCDKSVPKLGWTLGSKIKAPIKGA
jgi:hypothetical protein